MGHGSLTPSDYRNALTSPLAFVADVSHCQQSTLRKHYRLADVVVASMIRLGWIEYHSAVTWSVRITAAGRAELQRRRAA
jgi:hypothetical protein